MTGETTRDSRGAGNDAQALLLLTFGRDFLAYVLVADLETVDHELRDGVRSLTKRQRSALDQLWQYWRELAPERLQPRWYQIYFMPWRLGPQVNPLGVFIPEAGTTVANSLRCRSGGRLPRIDDKAPRTLGHILNVMCRDIYPLMLLPAMGDGLSAIHSVLGSSLRNHPLAPAFESAVPADRRLARLFTRWRDSAIGCIRENTGTAGGVSQKDLPLDLLSGGWRWAELEESLPSPDVFRAATHKALEAVRAAADGEVVMVPARAGLVGVLLHAEVDLGWGRLRPADERDKKLVARAGLSNSRGHSLSTITPALTVRFSGDVILETNFPYEMEVGVDEESLYQRWDKDPRWPDYIEERLEEVCIGLAVACGQDPIVRMVPAWKYVLEPFGARGVPDWRDVSSASSKLRPHKVTESLAVKWKDRAQFLFSHRRHIGLSLRLAMRALVDERNNPEDVLLDSVFGLESLLGSRRPAPGGNQLDDLLARLIRGDAADRELIKEQVRKIYKLRNKIAHGDGSRPPRREVEATAETAVSLFMQTLDSLIEKQPGILDEATSRARRDCLERT